ncbi:Uncharacterised protein [Vibrio cholerae]|nr:Uncharacterised protein [Vibrio cholerae]
MAAYEAGAIRIFPFWRADRRQCTCVDGCGFCTESTRMSGTKPTSRLSDIPFLLEAAAVLAMFVHPNHIVYVVWE